MSAKIEIGNLGNSEAARALLKTAAEFFKQVSGCWEVRIVGTQENITWQITVTAPDGREDTHINYDHNIEGTILPEVRKIVQRLSLSYSQRPVDQGHQSLGDKNGKTSK